MQRSTLHRSLFLFLFILMGVGATAQQTGTIRGFVYDKKTGEPMIFTNVFLEGTSKGASTDENGYFSIANVDPGSYTLRTTNLGYDTLRKEVQVEKGGIVNEKLYLQPTEVEIEEVVVSGDADEKKNQVKMSVEKITPKQIEQLPTVGGSADLAQYLQVLPGVVFTGDQGGQLYIRGGSPIQNKVLLDDMIIYNPFHSIGLFSVFDTDIIQNADIHTGGFNAEYGGRISSVMDITTRDGAKDQIGGKISASPFLAKTLIEGPISKPDKPGDGGSSFIFSTKHSYLERTSKSLYTGIDGIDSAGLPFNFTDVYSKISFNGKGGSKFNVFGFSFNDQVTWKSISDLNWNTFGGGTNFVLAPAQTPVLIEGNLAFSDYEISLEEKGVEDQLDKRTSSINAFNFGLDFKYFPGGNNELKYGLDVVGNGTDFNFFNSVGRRIGQEKNNTEMAAYVTYKIKAGLLVIEPSFRAQYYASLSELSPEPRLGIKYNVNEYFRLKGAAGIYSQNLLSTTSNRDVVNLFTGFLTAPDDLQDEIRTKDGDTEKITHPLQKANHYILGFEADPLEDLEVNVEGYFKDFTQLINLNRNKVFKDNPQNRDVPDIKKKDFIVEQGKAMGVDVVLKYQTPSIYLWAVYSLGHTTRWDGIREYDPVFDRRHSVNLIGTYRFGKERNWELNARWNLGSGFPFTRTQGVYEGINFQEDGIGTDYKNKNGELAFAYEDFNKGRLPAYHRLDLNIKRTFEISDRSSIVAEGGVTNAYDRNNVFFFDRVKQKRVNQLPILPSVSMKWKF